MRVNQIFYNKINLMHNVSIVNVIFKQKIRNLMILVTLIIFLNDVFIAIVLILV